MVNEAGEYEIEVCVKDLANGGYSQTYTHTISETKVKFEYAIETPEDGSAQYARLSKYNGNARNVTMPGQYDSMPVRSIDRGVLAGKSILQQIMLDEGIVELTAGSMGVFQKCPLLEQVNFPSTLEIIGKYTLYDCDGFTGMTLPEGLKILDEAAFYEYNALMEINLPETLTTIGRSCFSYTAITELHLPDSVTTVDHNTFGGLSGQLKKLRWTAGNPVVPTGRFGGFSALETAILPASLEEIADDALMEDVLCVIAPEGSKAADYAKAHGMKTHP